MDFYKYINRYFVYPLYYFKNKDKRLHRFKQLEKQQFWPKQAILDLQLQQLQSIVRYAYDHTDYYRLLLDKVGLHPKDIQSLKDIEKIPPLTKTDIQNFGDQMISDEFSKFQLIKDASGGSTGEPTIFYRNLESQKMRPADQLRHDQWSGWKLGDRFALIWGAQRDLSASKSFKEFIISRYIARIWELDAFEMTQESMHKYVATLEKIKPKMILGYANALALFSEFLLEHYPQHNIRVKGIVSSAETLTDKKREIIEKAFSCKVLNRYGSREVGLIASECPEQKGLHINADNLYVEVTQDGKSVKAGERGDILVTDFTNKGMPLIRYKLGDVGRMTEHDCSCGRGLPLMDAIEGRTGDFFVSDSNGLVHGEYFTHLFYGIPEVKKFQMVQESNFDISLKLVSDEKNPEADYIKLFKDKTTEMLGSRGVIHVDFVKDIPPTASGKTIFTISKVAR